MAAVLEVLGLVSDVFGLVGFGQDALPQQNSKGSTIRVTVGLDVSGGLNNAGGDVPDIRLFNEAGGFLGMKADPGKVSTGDFHDVTVPHESNTGQQATYTLFSANNDAICIAYSSITWASGDQYGWTGDWGKACGGTWYYSNIYISASGVMPNCTWIDANGDQPITGLQIHWPEFVNTDGTNGPGQANQKPMDYYCNSGPPFKMYTNKDPNSIVSWPAKTRRDDVDNDDDDDDDLSERQLPATEIAYGPAKSVRSAKFRDEKLHRRNSTSTSTSKSRIASSLVVGDNDMHSAAGLCASETSYGPDLYHTRHGQFCRMSDKKLFPVCSATVTDNCFNSELMKLVINGVAARDEPYSNVIDWSGGIEKK
ncbi:hypothetical protein GGR50DRAFT_115061 [Xylaria sp. CBS 124048]|nr:hypothetical protein GGR50DRAFT_115061 [Xylaria sp. CBS 124048]